jgi:hypothetical protein
MVMPETDSALLLVGQSWLFVLLRYNYYNYYVVEPLFSRYVCFPVRFLLYGTFSLSVQGLFEQRKCSYKIT